MRSDIRALHDCLADKGVLLPGAANALSARIIADLGFRAVYLTGAGLTNMHLGLPDLGFMDLSQAVAHTLAIREVTELPLIVDADTGFGNALNVVHAVRMLERAGASAIQLEDQRSPKRCGHFTGKDVVPTGEMIGNLGAPVEGRREGAMGIAQTDARAVEGFAAALERASRYVEAGADITFVEAPESLDEVRAIPRSLGVPQILNIVAGGRTPTVDRDTAAEMGFGFLLFANAALQGAILGMQAALGALKEHGSIDEAGGLVATFRERQRLVGKPDFDDMARRYDSEAQS